MVALDSYIKKSICEICGSGRDLSIDHIIPQAYFKVRNIKCFANRATNKRTLCTDCNTDRGSNLSSTTCTANIKCGIKTHAMVVRLLGIIKDRQDRGIVSATDFNIFDEVASALRYK